MSDSDKIDKLIDTIHRQAQYIEKQRATHEFERVDDQAEIQGLKWEIQKLQAQNDTLKAIIAKNHGIKEEQDLPLLESPEKRIVRDIVKSAMKAVTN